MYITEKNIQYSNEEIKAKELRIWFVSTTITSMLAFLTASIVVIEFSKSYKGKSYFQSIIFLIISAVILGISLFYSNNVLNFMSRANHSYDEYIALPRILQGVNYLFIIYIIYVAFKRFNIES